MGAIQVEVRTLKGKRPIVFAWENPIKKTVECFLVSCPCQQIGFVETKHMATDPDGAVKCDKTLASALVLALEKGDLFTHASLDHVESLVKCISEQEVGQLLFQKRERPDKNDQRKQKEKKQKISKEEISQDFESMASAKEGPATALAECDNVSSNTTDPDEPMDETTEEILNTPPSEKEPPSLPLEICLENKSTLLDEKQVKSDDSSDDRHGHSDVISDDRREDNDVNSDDMREDNDVISDDRREDNDVNSDDIQGKSDVNSDDQIKHVDTPGQSTMSHDLVNNVQNINVLVTTVPGSNESFMEIVALGEDVDVVLAAATAASVAPVHTVHTNEGLGLMEAINSIIEEYPTETKVAHPQDSAGTESSVENLSSDVRKSHQGQIHQSPD